MPDTIAKPKKLIFSTVVLLGCTALVATKNDIELRRFRGIIFIVFSMILYLISLVVLYVYVFSYEDLDSKSLLIAITRALLSYLSLFINASLICGIGRFDLFCRSYVILIEVQNLAIFQEEINYE
jgi:hypothetical protein